MFRSNTVTAMTTVVYTSLPVGRGGEKCRSQRNVRCLQAANDGINGIVGLVVEKPMSVVDREAVSNNV